MHAVIVTAMAYVHGAVVRGYGTAATRLAGVAAALVIVIIVVVRATSQ
jgi:hypothetical protein